MTEPPSDNAPDTSLRWLIAAIAIVLIIGVVLTLWTAGRQDQAMREEMLTATKLSTVGINAPLVESMAGSEADLNKSGYQVLKSMMVEYRKADPNVRFAYLIGKRPDGRYFFFVDSEPTDSPDYSPPGQDYPEVSRVVMDTYSNGLDLTEGPSADRWGTWISGLVPVKNSTTGEVVAIFGMDVDARDWYWQVASGTIPVLAGTIIVIILIFVIYILHKRDRKERYRVRASENAVRESEERYRHLFSQAPVGIFLVDRDGTVFATNDRFEKIFEAARGQYFGVNTLESIKNAEFLAAIKEALHGGTGIFEGRYTSVITGVTKYLRLITEPLGTDREHPTGAIGIIEDITERKAADEEVRNIQTRLFSILEADPDLIIMVDRDYRLLVSNSKGHDLVVQTEPEKCGTCYSRFMLRDSPCDDCTAKQVFSTGKSLEREVRHPIDGRTRQVRAYPVRDSGGNVQYVVEHIHDITERRRAEEEIRLANRKLDLMTDVTYQDIQNKVTSLRGYVELSKDTPEGAPRDAIIRQEEDILKSIDKLIRKTKDYQKMRAEQLSWLHLEYVIREQYTSISNKGGIRIHLDLNGLEIFSDPLIGQVFHNLLDNTVSHGQKATKISITWHAIPGGVVIIFEDDGVGIPGDRKPLIFERVVGEGRFGLFFVHEFLELSGMHITENGEPGNGVRFEITVPDGAWRIRPE